MDGLRELATSPYPIVQKLDLPSKTRNQFISLYITPRGPSFDVERVVLDQANLSGFFQHGLRKHFIDSLRLIVVPTDQAGNVLMDRSIWKSILLQMKLDPWVEHLIRIGGNGFHHSGKANKDGEVASHFLGTTISFSIWTTQWDHSCQFYVNRYLVLDRRAVNQQFDHPLVTGLLNQVDLFKMESCSALYLPFILTVRGLRYRERKLNDKLDLVRGVERRTGHGSWGRGTFETQGETITGLTAMLGKALGNLGSTWKHLNMIEDLFVYLDTLSARMDHPEAPRSQRTKDSDTSIMKAVPILRQQAAAAREQCQYLESRVKNQSSVLFSFLTHQDSMINLQVANASRDLAEAARRDGSSMKTIAVLTMAFLPATFLAALFAIPNMGWDERNDLGKMYLACVVSITFVTFALWAAITQRQQITLLIRGLTLREPAGKRTVEVKGELYTLPSQDSWTS
ncbi:hypothetical protein QBC38DRAFT_487827 [Podospora fimiseda]|uniref:Uncharacterized protein n=1 Tax=Podospora fimiseda TaxID=252190 RepID=A0AAN7BHH5_9PEZI|nr:hypothetical protein QBC38DRAFT_487827 [Podospora fimiseda]